MISNDDPRHSTKAGYQAGCRKACCRHAQMVHQKLYRMGRKDRLVPNLGTLRRVQALKAIGYTDAQIGALIGRGATWSSNTGTYPTLLKSTADAFAKAYDRVSMTIPEGAAANRARMRSARLGYAPPLAWDDIDDACEKPTTGKRGRRDIAAEHAHLSAGGESDHTIARQLGLTKKSLNTMLARKAA